MATANKSDEQISIKKVTVKYSAFSNYSDIENRCYMVRNLIKTPQINGHFVRTDYKKKTILMHPTVNTAKVLNCKLYRKELDNNTSVVFTKFLPRNLAEINAATTEDYKNTPAQNF